MSELEGIVERNEMQRILKLLGKEAIVYSPHPGIVKKLT
jgi:hypothetical protein